MSVATQHTCRNVSETATLATSLYNAITVVHTSTSISKKALGYIHNYHILLTQANSSY
jgi:hypothetical protein